MHYFAYGSNLLAEEMAVRAPGATAGRSAVLAGWRFIINQRGVATIIEEDGAEVWGGLWQVEPEDIAALDEFEGVDHGRYARRSVTVTTEGHEPSEALTYVDPNSTPGFPRPGYLRKVVFGAKQFELPALYITSQLERDWSNL